LRHNIWWARSRFRYEYRTSPSSNIRMNVDIVHSQCVLEAIRALAKHVPAEDMLSQKLWVEEKSSRYVAVRHVCKTAKFFGPG
jgi:hypothetical protein